MNPLYAAIVAGVLGKQRKCGQCGKKQAIGRKSNDGRYHCKFCGHSFSKKELSR
jgi:transcription elongation factor Elf1